MVEEMLFRGIFFWLIFELLTRGRVPKLAAVSATILIIAIGYLTYYLNKKYIAKA